MLEQDIEMGENHGEIEVTIFVREEQEQHDVLLMKHVSIQIKTGKKPQLDKATRVVKPQFTPFFLNVFSFIIFFVKSFFFITAILF